MHLPAIIIIMNESESTKSVTVRNGHQLHYQLRGNGPHAILCIPGALGTALLHFLPQLEYFGREESGFTVVCMEPLGYGASRPPERDFVIEPDCDFFLKMDALDGYALMQALSFKKFSIFGYCNGGVSAIILAALHPESVQKLVIWGSTAYVAKSDLEIWEKTRDSSYWNQQIRAELQNIYGDSFESLWFRYVDTVKDIYEKRKDGDLCMEEVKRVQCPTLIVHGAKDRLCPQFHADYLKENIRGSEMVVMEEGTHALQFKCAQEFNKLTERFLLK